MIGRTLIQYQQQARSTAIYPGQGEALGLIYTALKLAGESGEFAEKIGKAIRDESFGLDQQEAQSIRPDRKQALILELGDVLWYIANAAAELGYGLDYVAEKNLEKLKSRTERGKLQGSGDDR